MFAMEGSGAAIGNGDWLLGLSCVCVFGADSALSFAGGSLFGGIPYVFAKSKKLVWNEWDARMGIFERGEAIEFERFATGREWEA
jgi:hypothetical protein